MNAAIPPEPTSPPPISPPHRPWLVPGVLGVLAGLIVGVLVGVFLLGSGGAGGSADGDAHVACDYIASVSDEIEPDESLDLDEPVIWRLQAIGPLAVSAAKADARYQEFGDQGMDLYSAVSRIDSELLMSTLEAMAESCESF